MHGAYILHILFPFVLPSLFPIFHACLTIHLDNIYTLTLDLDVHLVRLEHESRTTKHHVMSSIYDVFYIIH